MMKKYVSRLLIALMFCAVISVGCGGLLTLNSPRA